METFLAEHTRHYAHGDLDGAVDVLLSTLTSNGATPAVTDLAGLDQFHTGGLQATRALAQQAAISVADHVLDVGGGIGGPARLLAAEIGCHVTVLDLTEAYCRIGERLTAAVGLSERVRFQQGDALTLPFADNSFDVVWTQHSSMNIADKTRLAAELARMLRPGGRLALYEVVAGGGDAPHFPVPWARSPMTSFLTTEEELRRTLTAAGFDEQSWHDRTDWTVEWLRSRAIGQPQPSTAPLPDLRLLLGPDFPLMARNLARNLQEGRIRIIEAVLRRHHAAEQM